MNGDEYSQHSSEESFWEKLRRQAKTAGKVVVQKALELFYAAQAAEAPRGSRA